MRLLIQVRDYTFKSVADCQCYLWSGAGLRLTPERSLVYDEFKRLIQQITLVRFHMGRVAPRRLQ